MNIEIMYPVHNRLGFVEATFGALLENTDWSRVSRLHVTDDRSRDGSYEWLSGAVRDVPVPVTLTRSAFGGPVAAMNHVIDRCESDVIAKLDSDCVVCPGWLEHMLATLNANPNIDALGIEPGFGDPVAPLDVPRGAKPAPFIGGVFLAHTRVFARRPRMNNRWFGLTEMWRKQARCAWITPDLPVFLLDHIRAEPWASLAQDYIRAGWSRAWSEYFDPPAAYFDWWLRERAAVA